ncbi:S26 family signal peptidase [Luteimonas kalidii]|uniref:S26 family signal peptidase n=1 Tax=Luteimonas kalidii TaxID=3042025 RepID=A0ABT6JZ57_9GAMM|nr:S26 family signal peptidase [Luteimonas kalidii]MDH5835341.1 S26 family signal peptidase [Luteimonas kalidii]
MTRQQRRLLGTAAVTVLLIALATFAPWPAPLFYNPSDSAPRGWYLLRPMQAWRPGTPVFARLSASAAQLAHRRGYLPQHLPVLKRIGAVGGQHVCVRNGVVRIDGREVARVLERDGHGRPLAAWPGCRTLAPDEVFLFAARHPASFDSRYFGPDRRDAILGRAVPLWTW